MTSLLAVRIALAPLAPFHHVLNLSGEGAAAWGSETLQHVGVVLLAVWRIHQGVRLDFD